MTPSSPDGSEGVLSVPGALSRSWNVPRGTLCRAPPAGSRHPHCVPRGTLLKCGLKSWAIGFDSSVRSAMYLAPNSVVAITGRFDILCD